MNSQLLSVTSGGKCSDGHQSTAYKPDKKIPRKTGGIGILVSSCCGKLVLDHDRGAAFPLYRMDSRFHGNDKHRFPQQELVT